MSFNSNPSKVTEGSVSRQIRFLKEGSSRTRAEAIEKLFPALRQKAHRIAHGKLRGTGADSEVAGASAARRTIEDIQTEKVEIPNRHRLQGLLTQRAFDTATESLRKSLAKKRGLKVTQSLGDLVRNGEGNAREFEIRIEDKGRVLEQDLLNRLTAALPEDCRAVLAFYLEGSSNTEIGARLGISDDAAGRRIKKILKLARKLFDAK